MSSQPKLTPIAGEQRRRISILGSTGTIGCNTLDIVRTHSERFEVTALTAGNNVDALIEQARTYKPQKAVIANEAQYQTLKDALADLPIEVAAGYDAVIEAAQMPTDIVMSAIVGAAGLQPTLAAMKQGTQVALANKECLVCAGEIMLKTAAQKNVVLLPVDSEHSAIFQVLQTREAEHIAEMTVTASGGPFRTFSKEQMKSVTPAQAVKHPNWNMGAKISVDSATLMNKGLELIEAYYLFPVEADQLSVLVHPQSIVHCLLRMVDGSVLAQMSPPDMRTPIAYAMAWPERVSTPMPPLNLAEIGKLEFEPVDHARFPAVNLAMQAMRAGGNAPTVLNAANEIAVSRFLRGEISFLDIIPLVEKTLAKAPHAALHSLEDVLACDQQTRDLSETL